MKTSEVLFLGALISWENLVSAGTCVARLNLSNNPNKTSLSLDQLYCCKIKLSSTSSNSAHWL